MSGQRMMRCLLVQARCRRRARPGAGGGSIVHRSGLEGDYSQQRLLTSPSHQFTINHGDPAAGVSQNSGDYFRPEKYFQAGFLNQVSSALSVSKNIRNQTYDNKPNAC